jgi:hypothetical protein
MNTLFYFKIGGAMLAGLGASIKVVKEIVEKWKQKRRKIETIEPYYLADSIRPRSEQDPHSFAWETIELVFIFGGLVVNLVATAIDQKQTIARNESANAQIAKQLQDAEESLNYLERLGTRFETLSFSVTFRLAPYREYRLPAELNDKLFPVFSSARSQSANTSLAILPKQKNWFLGLFHLHKNDQVIGTNLASINFEKSNGQIERSIDRYVSKTYFITDLAHFCGDSIDNDVLGFIFEPQVYLNIVAAKSPEKDLHHSGDFPMRATGYEYVPTRPGVFYLSDISDTGFKGPFPIMGHGHVMLRGIRHTGLGPDPYVTPDVEDLDLDLHYAENASTKGDLFGLATKCNRIAHFTFIPATKELLVRLDFDCPKAGWEQTEWMTSWPDLANAILFLGVTNVPQNQPNRIVPVSGTFKFDQTTITITNFFPCKPLNWHGCELPDKRAILDMR